MTSSFNKNTTIIRTERGLIVSGTGLSLYDVMDLLKAQHPPKAIRDKFNLTDEHVNVALSYFEVNRDQVGAEYQHIDAALRRNSILYSSGAEFLLSLREL
ncbi:MAG: hypothetical protein ACFBSC_01580 [Microcoleaceae cyanobacterium]